MKSGISLNHSPTYVTETESLNQTLSSLTGLASLATLLRGSSAPSSETGIMGGQLSCPALTWVQGNLNPDPHAFLKTCLAFCCLDAARVI